MQVRTQIQDSNASKRALKALEYAINQGLTNSEIDFFTEPKNITFREYIGARKSEGSFRPDDNIQAGLFIYGEDNFAESPNAVFEIEDCKVAFYEL